MSALAVILARGGSKGIPRKNLVPIGGVPLLGRSISAAKRCDAINDVVVSTDSPEIAQVARSYGAKVVDRPADLASDQASSESALQHAAETWGRLCGKSCDLLLLVQCTSPFQDPTDMQAVIDVMNTGRYNSCITVTETFRYFWAEGASGWYMPYQKRGRRQERRPWFEEAGSLYCVRYEAFMAGAKLFVPPVGTHAIPWWRSFEIDEPQDIKLAEALCSAFQ
jgi:N-acylneuraminate cytidylyltransferase